MVEGVSRLKLTAACLPTNQCTLARNPNAPDCVEVPCGTPCDRGSPSPPAAPAPPTGGSAPPPAPTDRAEFYCEGGAEFLPPAKTCGKKTPWGAVPPTDDERTAEALAKLDPDVRQLLSTLTLEQKVGQMVQLNIDEVRWASFS